jgi:hypothetical protein
MVALATLAECKLFLGIPTAETVDDALITWMLTGIIAVVNARFPSKWEAETLTRYYDPTNPRHVQGRELLLGKPLLAVTTLTNGDSAVITPSYYTKWPVNGPPYTRIILKASSAYSWTYTTDPEAAISVVGTWGYSTSCPADINQAVVEWVAYEYRKKDAQVFDVTADPNSGRLFIPAGIPVTVEAKLNQHGRSPL